MSRLIRHIRRLSGLFFCMLILAHQAFALDAAPSVTEMTGARVPLDAVFTDEAGKRAPLGAMLGKPAILSFAYFSCQDQCNTVLSNLATALGRTNSVPGKDFSVLTVSFDDKDTVEAAGRKKKGYMAASGRLMDNGAWRFLTGQKASIEALTGSAGFVFRKTQDGFDHPAALAVLSSDGRIIRYIYGSSYLPADLEMALKEAGEGRITASIKKAARLCFSDEPGGRGTLAVVLRWAGVLTLALAAGVYFYITASGRPGKKDPR